MLAASSLCAHAQTDSYGWLNNETLETRYGTFEFKNGYPVGDATARLLDMQKLNRAIEVYTTQMMRVSEIAAARGHARVWITDAAAGRHLGKPDGRKDGIAHGQYRNGLRPEPSRPEDRWTDRDRSAAAHARLHSGRLPALSEPTSARSGRTRVRAENSWSCRRVTPGAYPTAISFLARRPTRSLFAVRGFQVDNKTDQAVALMKQIKVYPLAKASAPPPMQFMNGSNQNINTVFPDTLRYFELLAMLVNEEPAELFDPLERWQMQAIGIEKGKPFSPDEKTKALLSEAARIGGAIARANTYDDPATVYYYPNRKWQQMQGGLTYTFARDGVPQIDVRNNVYYMAAGNSPAMMAKNVGQGSQYLWTYRDAKGDFLDGGKTYRLHVLPNIPAKAFWSVVVYDALSRSELQNGQPLPSVSSYVNPKINADGSVDIVFGPNEPQGGGNWIRTVPGKGWFPIFRFYSPTEAFFDKTWALNDIEAVQ